MKPLCAGRYSLFAGRCALVATRCSLCAGRYSLVASRWWLLAGRGCGIGVAGPDQSSRVEAGLLQFLQHLQLVRKSRNAMSIKSYRDLDTWKVAMDLAVSIYGVVARLPPYERFELCSQMRRAAVSVPSNVAEGQANGPGRRYRNHVRIASGSVAELSTCVELCLRVGYIEATTASHLQDEIARTGRLLQGLRKSILRKTATNGSKVLAVVIACWWLFK